MSDASAIYHYCTMHQVCPGEIRYDHGSGERQPPIATNKDYRDFCEQVAENLGIPSNQLIFISVTRL